MRSPPKATVLWHLPLPCLTGCHQGLDAANLKEGLWGLRANASLVCNSQSSSVFNTRTSYTGNSALGLHVHSGALQNAPDDTKKSLLEASSVWQTHKSMWTSHWRPNGECGLSHCAGCDCIGAGNTLKFFEAQNPPCTWRSHHLELWVMTWMPYETQYSLYLFVHLSLSWQFFTF